MTDTVRRVVRALVGLGLLVGGCGGGSPGGADGGPMGSTPPLISGFSPAVGSPGTTVIIEGLLFGDSPSANTVRFNGVKAAVQSATSHEIAALVPEGATTGPIQVSTAGGSATSAQPFTVLSSSTTPGVAWTTRLLGPREMADMAWDGTKLVAVGSSVQSSRDLLRWEQRNSLTSLSAVGWNGQSFIAVGFGSVLSSSTGLTWSVRPRPGAELSDLTTSGTLWVAVGEAGAIRTSTDGVTWLSPPSPTSSDLRAVAWSGSQFVAVGEAGTVLTSPDGATWTARSSGTTADFTAVGATATLMVATTQPAHPDPSLLLTSPDGVTWTVRSRELPSAYDIVHAAGRWVLASNYRVITSTDGLAWSVAPGKVGFLSSVVHTGQQFVAMGGTGSGAGAVYTSDDGLAWNLRSSDQKLRAITRAPDGRLVAVGTSEVSLTSTDEGATWQFGRLEDSTGNLFIDVEWAPGLGAFVATASEGHNQRTHVSTDGLVWTARGNTPYDGRVGASPTMIVNVGSSLSGPGIATTSDGHTWTARTSPITQRLEDVFWTGTQFLAVGRAGSIVTSADGVTWTLRPSGSTSTLNAAAALPGLLVVVGEKGTILTSSDGGGTWSARTSGTTYTLQAVEWTGQELVAVGPGGTAVRSSDGLTWTPHPTPFGSTQFGATSLGLTDLVWSPTGKRLVVVGTGGLVASSP